MRMDFGKEFVNSHPLKSRIEHPQKVVGEFPCNHCDFDMPIYLGTHYPPLMLLSMWGAIANLEIGSLSFIKLSRYNSIASVFGPSLIFRDDKPF